MTKDEVVAILGSEYVTESGHIHDLGGYVNWKSGDDSITLDGAFTVKELEALIWLMRHGQAS